MAKRVIITDHDFPAVADEHRIAEECGAEFEVLRVTEASEVAEATTGADVLIVGNAAIDETVSAGLADGATVIRYDSIDVDAASAHGVRVCNIPDYGADTVADHTVMLMLAVLRRVRDFTAKLTTEDGWMWPPEIGEIPAVADCVVGLVGTGQIGRKVAARIRAFGATVIAYDPYADAAALKEEGIELTSLDEVLAKADILSIHAPLTPETKHIVNAESIGTMKDTAVIVNTARGGLIDTVAAAEAVTAGRLGGLGIDVYETEPLEAGHPLRSAPRTLLTPHAAYYSARALKNLQLFAAEEMGRALRGETLRCQVNRKAVS